MRLMCHLAGVILITMTAFLPATSEAQTECTTAAVFETMVQEVGTLIIGECDGDAWLVEEVDSITVHGTQKVYVRPGDTAQHTTLGLLILYTNTSWANTGSISFFGKNGEAWGRLPNRASVQTMTPGGMPVTLPVQAGTSPKPSSAPMLPGTEIETVTLMRVDGENAIVRRDVRLYLLQLGVGCLGASMHVGRQVYVVSPVLFAGVGSSLVLPNNGGKCPIWSSQQLN